MKKLMTIALTGALALGAATTITSCNKGGDEPQRDEVKIVTSVAGMTATRAPQLDETGQGTFSTGDTFGLLVRADNETAATKRFDYTVGSTKLYCDQLPAPDAIKGNSFYAVYPNVPEFNSVGVTTSFDFNAATAAYPDLLWAKGDVILGGKSVNLKFKHTMHRLVVNLTTNYYTPQELAEAKVQPVMKTTASVKAFDGSVNLSAATDGGTPYPVKTGAGTVHIVAPQGLGAGQNLLITIPGRPAITYTIPAALQDFQSGYETTLNLALNRDLVSIEGMDVGQWNDLGGTPYNDTVTVTE